MNEGGAGLTSTKRPTMEEFKGRRREVSMFPVKEGNIIVFRLKRVVFMVNRR